MHVNPLVDIMSPKARRISYGIVALLLLVMTAWQTADGNWLAALTSLVGTAYTALAHANTDTTQDPGA